MIFTVEHIQKLIDEKKNETRRVCQNGETAQGYYPDDTFWRGLFNSNFPIPPDVTLNAVYAPSGRLKWCIGDTYAVQPGRGLPCALWCNNGFVLTFSKEHTCTSQEWKAAHLSAHDPEINPDAAWRELRIKLLEIRREPLQAISEADAVAEGYPAKWPPPTMAAVHDGFISMFKFPQDDPVTWYRKLWKTINGPKSWDTNPNVWCLTFEVVR